MGIQRLLTLLTTAALLQGCGEDGPPPELRTGAQLYNYYCAECHQGSGDGTFLKGVPPIRYTDRTYRELVEVIMGHNRPQKSRMPQFDISKQHAEAIAIHIRRKLRAD